MTCSIQQTLEGLKEHRAYWFLVCGHFSPPRKAWPHGGSPCADHKRTGRKRIPAIIPMMLLNGKKNVTYWRCKIHRQNQTLQVRGWSTTIRTIDVLRTARKVLHGWNLAWQDGWNVSFLLNKKGLSRATLFIYKVEKRIYHKSLTLRETLRLNEILCIAFCPVLRNC